VPGIVPGKPDTVLNSTVKILDIGLGRETFDESLDSLPADQLTGEGVLLGTPDYLAPEQARDARSVDIRADIYSVGCVLHYALVGQPPFPDTSVLNQIIRHAKEEPRRLKELNSEVPDGLQQIVSFMMAKDPGQRYPTPERAAKALQVFLPGQAGAAEKAVAKKEPKAAGEIPTGKLVTPKEPRKSAEKVKEKAENGAVEAVRSVAPAPPSAAQVALMVPAAEYDV